jgi:serine/threonine protein phosphatase PrpC
MTTPVVEVTAFTHQGALRANNEDAVTVAGWVSDIEMSGPRRTRHELLKPLAFAVADGMGGHAAGEVASRYASKRLAEEMMEANETDVAARLTAINAELYQTMAAVAAFRGMGTTAAGLVLAPQRAIWFNVGDSRIYRDRRGLFEQLSIDDVPPGRRTGIITQTLGGGFGFMPIAPHIAGEALMLPSRWLICSDGLTDMVEDSGIAGSLALDDESAVRSLFTLAMEAGGADNISILVVSVGAPG